MMELVGGVDLNHRPLGYECHHQRNPKTMRGAKSNELFLRRVHCHLPVPALPRPKLPAVGLRISGIVDRILFGAAARQIVAVRLNRFPLQRFDELLPYCRLVN
jgi:hypothetical protein